jgi:tight adherence protein B
MAVTTAAPSSASTPAAPSAQPGVTTVSGHHRVGALTRNIGLGSLFVAFAIVALLAIDGRLSHRRRELADVVGDYAPALGGSAPTLVAADERQARSAQLALQMTDRLLKAHGWGERLALRLERAGLSIRANEWLVLQIVVSVSLTAVFVLLGANIVVAAVVCVLASEIVMRLWLGHRIERRRAAFLGELPDALQVLAGSISTGYSLDQAIDALLDDAQEPIAGEFGRASSEARLGVPLDNALAECARRVQLEEFDWAVMAIQVQRTVGGSLAEVLRNVASTIRQREKLRRQARVLSAEGRISAYILVALPLLMAAFFLLFKPAYFRPMYTSPGGVMALFVGVVLLVLGWAWMSKLAKVEV